MRQLLGALLVGFIILGSGLSPGQVQKTLQEVEGLTGLQAHHRFTVKIVKPWQMETIMPGAVGRFLPGHNTIIISEEALDHQTLGHEMAHMIYMENIGLHPEKWAEDIESRLGKNWP